MRPLRVAILALIAGVGVRSPLRGQSPPHKIVVLSPLTLPEGLDSLPQAAVVESLLTAELTAAGYTVIPSRDAGVIWKRLVDSVQGFYSPLTGDLDSAKYRAVHDGTHREVFAQHAGALWLRDSVTVVIVEWSGNAEWDGMKERVGHDGSGGKVPALTLVIEMEDSAGAIAATGRGGLQVLLKSDGDSYSRVPMKEIFGDVKRMRKGVRAALQTALPAGALR